MRSGLRLYAILAVIGGLLSTSAYSVPARALDGDYRQAEQVFNTALLIDERILFQVLMTASGQWNAVPAPQFTKRLYAAIKRFQSENGFVPTGIPDHAFFDRLFLVATPMLNLWGFQWVSHLTRGYKVWMPIGLGLKQSNNEFGTAFDDTRGRIRIDFTTVPNVSVSTNFEAVLAKLLEDGSKIHYQTAKQDWYAISFARSDGMDGYVRYHQDGPNVTGFSLYWDNRNGNINGERIAVLMSASLRSSIGGARFIDPPRQSQSATVPVAPQSPIEQGLTPSTPKETTPKRENKISSGTGFFIARDGAFVTNAHVIDGCSIVVVRTDDGSIGEAKIIARDTTNDLALLRVKKSPQQIARLRVGPRLGESVAAFGFPHADILSSNGNFTLGNITALSGLGDDSRHLQISTPVQSGNSGGPLLDLYGNVVGVVALKLNALKVALKDGDLPQNVNFAVKSAILASFLDANNVPFEGAAGGQKSMEPADVADHARAISGFVLCD